MKVLWLCNMMPGVVKQAITGKEGNGLWVDHVLHDLRQQENLAIRVLCPGTPHQTGALDASCSYSTFRTKAPYTYLPEVESRFRQELKSHWWSKKALRSVSLQKW